MNRKNGVYRVIYDLPGSVGYFSQQFMYENSKKSVLDIAKELTFKKESKRYNINKSDINIVSIKYMRDISKQQSKLTNIKNIEKN